MILSPPSTCHCVYPSVCFSLHSESFVRLWAPGCGCYGCFGTELDLCWAAASVCSHHAHRTKVRTVTWSSLCVFVRTAVSFSLIMSTCYSVIQLSLIDVAVFCSEPRRSRGFAAQLYCLCPFVQPHNINCSPLPPLVKPAETSGTSWCSARALMPAGDDRSMSALWNTFRLASLSPTTREENWPFISSAHWAHAPPCCSPGTQKNTPLQTPTDEL